LEQAYSPDGLPSIRIEHGHQYDPINKFFINGKPIWSPSKPNSPIFDDCDGVPRLYECIGTRFLNRYLNILDESYPFVDNVKPFSKFLNIFLMSSIKRPVKAFVALWGMLKFLVSTGIAKPTDVLSINVSNIDSPLDAIKALRGKLSSKEKEEFYDKIRARNYTLDRAIELIEPDSDEETSLLEFLSENLDIFDAYEKDSDNDSTLSISGNGGTLALRQGFNIDESKELKNNATKIFNNDNTIEIIIMGHTLTRFFLIN
jgi:hypothetical protein